MHLAETTAEARERARAGFMDYYRVIEQLRKDYQQWLARRGLDTTQSTRPVPWGEMTFERLCAEHAIVSDSDAAVAEIRRLGKETGATQILCWMNMGSIAHELVLRSMETFAREVLPRLV
jgi:alkanesulfonate monooxygenase SsuD/methylene tetrahydromethanopterin reductase-like flavin-dependent oxidoreductase (luciferase family)